MKVNINNVVKVKLTDEARMALENEYKNYSNILKEELKPNIDEDGYFHEQLWRLMKDFGCMIRDSYSPILEIIIDGTPISMNQEVKAKLTEEAGRHIKYEYQSLSYFLKKNIEPNIDDEGYHNIPLIDIMKYLGHMIKGCYSPILNCELTIEKILIESVC